MYVHLDSIVSLFLHAIVVDIRYTNFLVGKLKKLLLSSSNLTEPYVQRTTTLVEWHGSASLSAELLANRLFLVDSYSFSSVLINSDDQSAFPVTYNDKFYKYVLEVGELAKLAYFNDIGVGAVSCRVDNSATQHRLYIMTLDCLFLYGRLGMGTVMLNHVLKICEEDGNFDNVFLHVQLNNVGAIKFYEKFGLEIVEEKKNYYKRIEPADAYVLQKTFTKTKQQQSLRRVEK
ncbi:N-alpha-acetyltransferase 50-like [Octopus sinensis]|uniref:N-terminal methionine N(alpha)-acetyltransferase NatE n=1 Tax=Octopus sinensis TaxID=2607531 RepID=A0A7E6ELX1_9MOLL|nr:N-alpha-acetyltransferase 50-like [Octopus sinensis]